MFTSQTASGHLSTQADLLGASSDCLEHGRGDCMLTFKNILYHTDFMLTFENILYYTDYMLTFENIFYHADYYILT